MGKKEELFNSHYSLVVKYAKQYSNNFNLEEDLIQEGSIGLCKAIKNYSQQPNCKFSTYAVFWIKGEILKYLKKNFLVYIPDSKREERRANIVFSSDKDLSHENLNACSNEESPDFFLNDTQLKMQVEYLLEGLDSEEQKILMLRYGIGVDKAFTLKEISDLLFISINRVRDKQIRAENKLKSILSCKKITDFLDV